MERITSFFSTVCDSIHDYIVPIESCPAVQTVADDQELEQPLPDSPCDRDEELEPELIIIIDDNGPFDVYTAEYLW